MLKAKKSVLQHRKSASNAKLAKLLTCSTLWLWPFARTWRIIPGLGYVVNNHGDRFRPLIGSGWIGPLPNGLLLYGGHKWGVIRSPLTMPGSPSSKEAAHECSSRPWNPWSNRKTQNPSTMQNSKRTPTYPWSIPQAPQTPKWKEILHKPLVGGLGYVPGVCCRILRKILSMSHTGWFNRYPYNGLL